MFRAIPDDEALAAVRAAWDNGIRYYNTAPFYGSGLSEIRVGEALADRPRDEYVLSTKVGRVILVAQDFHGDVRLQKFEEARTGAFRVLSRLRDEGVIKAWGLGVNRTEPIEITLALDEPHPDGFLLAGRYSLPDHEHALQRLLPMAEEQGLGMVVGGPYSSGILAGGSTFEYVPASAETIEKVKRIKTLCDEHGVGIKAAALQFSLANPVAKAGIPGSMSPGHGAEDVAALLPAEFWAALRSAGLVSPLAPLPGGA